MDNKVVTTVARALAQRGWRVVRFNYRGVGGVGRHLGRGPRRGRRRAGRDRRASRRRRAAGAGRLLVRRLRRGERRRATSPRPTSLSGMVLVAPVHRQARRAAGRRRHLADPRRGRRRRAAVGLDGLGAPAGAAGGRRARRRAFLPRPAGAAEVAGRSATLPSDLGRPDETDSSPSLGLATAGVAAFGQALPRARDRRARLPAGRHERRPGAGRTRRRCVRRPGLAHQADDGLPRVRRAEASTS